MLPSIATAHFNSQRKSKPQICRTAAYLAEVFRLALCIVSLWYLLDTSAMLKGWDNLVHAKRNGSPCRVAKVTQYPSHRWLGE